MQTIIYILIIIAQTFEKRKVFSEKIFAKNLSFPTIVMIEEAMKLEHIDPNTEAQVWQRVMGGPEGGITDSDLRPLLLAAGESAGIFRYLSGRLTGENRQRAKILHDRAVDTLACLRGIQTMTGGGGKVAAQPVPKEPLRRTLEKSYRRCIRAMTEYTARSLDPEFGVVFQKLAERERENCALILRILGEIGTV